MNSLSYKNILTQFFLFSALALICILFIDKPISIFLHNYKIDFWFLTHGFRRVTELFPIVIPILCLLIVIFAKPQIDIGKKWLYIIYLTLLTILTLEIKQVLKNIFGRFWPQTWTHNNLSLLHDNAYGFDWLNGEAHYNGSFPSGHTTLIAILAMSLLITYPRFSKLWYLLIMVIIFSLVVLNYHFLGDCMGALALCTIFSSYGVLLYKKLLGTKLLHKLFNSQQMN